MTDCKGLIGWIFGHKFKKHWIKYRGGNEILLSKDFPIRKVEICNVKNGINNYKICSRCGLILEDK